MRDLNLVVAFLLGKSTIRSSENPLGPAVYVRALLRAAEDTDLHKEAWEFFLTVFEKPLGDELATHRQATARSLREPRRRRARNSKDARRAEIGDTVASASSAGNAQFGGTNSRRRR